MLNMGLKDEEYIIIPSKTFLCIETHVSKLEPTKLYVVFLGLKGKVISFKRDIEILPKNAGFEVDNAFIRRLLMCYGTSKSYLMCYLMCYGTSKSYLMCYLMCYSTSKSYLYYVS